MCAIVVIGNQHSALGDKLLVTVLTENYSGYLKESADDMILERKLKESDYNIVAQEIRKETLRQTQHWKHKNKPKY